MAHLFSPSMSKISKIQMFMCSRCVFLTSMMSMREAMVSRVRGEKWLVIIILMPASEKESWWGYADSNSSTISTDGFLWKLAAHRRKYDHSIYIHPLHSFFKHYPTSVLNYIILHKCLLISKGILLPFLRSTAVASHPSSRSVLLVVPFPRFVAFFFLRSK